MCAITSAGFFWATTPDNAHFTLQLPNRSIHVTDDLLRGGWWNTRDHYETYKGKTYTVVANELAPGDPVALVQKHLPDVWALVRRLEREFTIEPANGVITFDPGTEDKFNVVGGVMGRTIDTKKLCADMLDAFKSGRHRDITVGVKVTPPTPRNEILGRIALRGGYKTNFGHCPNRENNIALALGKFNGLVINPGQTISFNHVVGPRSKSRGFLEAKIILEGEFVPGTGGGVCQASTTLFNALLLAGVRIDKSYNHSLPISYVSLGRDAMVSSVSDLKFTNDTGGTLYIETHTEFASPETHGSATVKIYGNKTNIKYKPRVVMIDVDPDEQVYTRKTRTYLDAYRGDRLVHTKFIRKSSYK